VVGGRTDAAKAKAVVQKWQNNITLERMNLLFSSESDCTVGVRRIELEEALSSTSDMNPPHPVIDRLTEQATKREQSNMPTQSKFLNF
jgi:hypothetical protein